MKKILYIIYSLIVWSLLILFIPIFFLITLIVEWWTPTYKKTGIYVVVGATGSGKSMFKTILERQWAKDGKKCITNESSTLDGLNFKLGEIFNNGDTQYNFNGSGVDYMTFDEIQLDFDNRDFKNDRYKKIFQPFAKFLSLHRHQKVKQVWFFTQSWDNLDIKIKRVAHYVIDMEHTKGFDLKNMKRLLDEKKLKGFLAMTPKKLKFVCYPKMDYETNREHYQRVKQGLFNTEMQVKDLDRYVIRIKSADLKAHNTYIFENYYADKETFNIKGQTYTKQQVLDQFIKDQKKKTKKKIPAKRYAGVDGVCTSKLKKDKKPLKKAKKPAPKKKGAK